MDTPASEIWDVFPESVLYGIFCVLLGVDIHFINLRGKKNATKANKRLLVVVSLMFVTATLHIACTVCAVYVNINMRFIEINNVLHSSWHEDVTKSEIILSITAFVEEALFISQIWMGDGFMLYRLWKVWNNDKRVVIPMTVAFIINLPVGALSIILSFDSMISLLATSCAVHLGCTVLISARIFYLHRQVSALAQKVSGPSSTAIAIVVLESGAIYSASVLCLLVVLETKIFEGYYMIVMNAIVPLIGIVFSAIIIRMGLGLSPEIYYTTQGNMVENAGAARYNADTTNSVLAFAPGVSIQSGESV